MPAALETDREAIRLMVVEYGCTETAKQTGIPLNTVLSWSARGEWLKPQKLPPSMVQPAIGAIKPHLAQQNILEHRKQQTRNNLSRFAVNASKVASKSRSPLADAAKVRDVATVMEKIWPEPKENQGGSGLVNVTLIRVELPTEQQAIEMPS